MAIERERGRVQRMPTAVACSASELGCRRTLSETAPCLLSFFEAVAMIERARAGAVQPPEITTAVSAPRLPVCLFGN